MRAFQIGLVIVLAAFWSGGAYAAGDDTVLVAEGLCSEMVEFVNGLADFTATKCLPGGSKTGTEFIFISEQPVFSVPASKKAWLMVVVAAVGKVLNDHPDYSAGALLFADVKMAATKQYESLPATTAKDLQRRTMAGNLDVDGMWAAISADVKPFKH